MAKSAKTTEPTGETTGRQKIITTEINRETGVMTFNVAGAGSFKFDTRAQSDENNETARYHGWKQKISDPAAKSAGASPVEKFEAMRELAQSMTATGNWSQRGGGDGSPQSGIIARAVHEYRNSVAGPDNQKTLDEIREFLAGKTRSEVLAFRQIPEIAVILDRLRGESAKSVDGAAMLADLLAA